LEIRGIRDENRQLEPGGPSTGPITADRKSCDAVAPATYMFPAASTVIARATSFALPSNEVEETALPPGSSLVTKTS
jgi:hypothetical protein